MSRKPTPKGWKASFNQRLVLARAEAYEVSGTLPRPQRGTVRAKFWIHWINRNALGHQAGTGGKS